MTLLIDPDLYVAAHTAVLDRLDAAGAGVFVLIQDAGGNTLGTLHLDSPCGTVDAETGRLTFAFTDLFPVGVLDGDAATATLYDAADTARIILPCAEGTAPVENTFVLKSLTVAAGWPLEVISGTLG